MAQLVVAAAGAAIGGSLITGTVLGMTGASIGWMAGSFIGGQLFGPKGQDVQGPRLGDLRVSGTEYGQTIPWVAGSPRIAGQIIWASNKRETATTRRAGKGGGSGSVTTYTYDVDLLILLTENETLGVSRIWSNGELVWNGSDTKDGVWADVRVYAGELAQLPDPDYEAAVGVGNAPAYRGMTTVFVKGLQLGSSGQIPNLSFEIGLPTVPPIYLWTDFASTLADKSCEPKGAPVVYAGTTPEPLLEPDGVSVTPASSTVAYGFSWRLLPRSPIETTEIFFPASDYCFEVDFTCQQVASGSSTPQIPICQLFSGPTQFGWRVMADPATGEFVFGLGSGPRISGFSPGARTRLAVERVGAALNFYLNGQNRLTLTALDLDPTSAFIGFGGALWVNFIGPPYDLFAVKFHGTRFSVGRYISRRPISRRPVCIAGQPPDDSLAGVCEKLLLRAGYTPEHFDLSELRDAPVNQVRGLALGQISPTRTPLEMFQSAWLLQASATDKIRIRRRPQSVSDAVPSDRLGLTPDGSPADPFAVTLANELEIPSSVSVTYNNTTADYSTATEVSERIASAQVESTTSVQIPMGMEPAEAKAVADRLVFDPIGSVMSVTVSVPLEYAAIEPGDCVNVTSPVDGITYRLRVNSKREDSTRIEWQCALDDPGSILSSAVTSDDYIEVTEPTQVAASRFAAMDIPLLRDADDAPGYYAVVGADRAQPTDSWPGAAFVQAFSPEQFEDVFQSGNSALIGDCLTTLPDFGLGNVFDEASTVEVRVSGELASTTRDAMLNDLTLNAALIGSEIVRFRLATLVNTDGARRTYRLSGLLRGQRGTEWAIGGHVANERFVLLRASDLRRVESTLTQIGLARDVKGVTLNQLLSSVAAVSFTDSGESLRPFSPANPRALANGANIDVRWQRRTRRAVRYGGTVDQVVPLGEASEQYRVRVIRAGTTLRTVTVTTPSWTYAAADITADGVTAGQSLTFEVRQVSAVVGEGRAASVTGVAP